MIAGWNCTRTSRGFVADECAQIIVRPRRGTEFCVVRVPCRRSRARKAAAYDMLRRAQFVYGIGIARGLMGRDRETCY